MLHPYIPIAVAVLVGTSPPALAQIAKSANATTGAATATPASPRVINRLDVSAAIPEGPTEASKEPAGGASPAQTPVQAAAPVVELPPAPPLVPRNATPATPPAATEGPARAAEPASALRKATVSSLAPLAKAKPKGKPVTLTVRVDLTAQRAHVSIAGAPVHTWPISSGKAGHETPTGTFRPQWMAKSWFSRTYDDAPMPHSVFFNSGIAFHGTTSVRLLGRPASRGCIRLAPKNAETLFGLVKRHGMASTRVVVVGKTPAPPRIAAKPNRRHPAVGAAAPRRPANLRYRPYAGPIWPYAAAPYRGGYYGAHRAPVRPRYRQPVRAWGGGRALPPQRPVVRRPGSSPWGWTEAHYPNRYRRY
jgi:lipoprotein-anchoring transpeptidase ErfK/SrfK